MQWSIETKVRNSFGLALLLLSTVSGTAYWSTIQSIKTANWVEHSQNVLHEIDYLLSIIKDAETGQRGYLLTKKVSYLEPFNAARAVISQRLHQLRRLTKDNPYQQQKLDALESILAGKIAELNETIRLRNNKGYEAALQVVLTNRGKQLMDNARTVASEIKAEETKLLNQRSEAAATSARTTTSVVGLGSLLAFGLIPLATFTINRDLVKRKQVEEALRLRDRAIAAASDSILIAGPPEKDDPIIYANPAFERLTGYAPTEFLGRNCRFLQGPGTDQDTVTQIRTTLQANQACHVILLNYRKDGTPFWNELTVTPTCNSKGSVVNYIGVARDVTQRKANEEATQALTHKLEQSNQELSDFARVASHDLQEPLRKIQVFGDRLSTKGLVQSEGQLYLERMQDAAKRMSTLIQDLLALSRVTTKVQPLVSVELAQLVQEVISDLEIRIEEVGGTVEVGALPTVNADRLQMRQLFQNLIGNALKFQRPGVAPIVQVWGQCTLEECQFVVTDNGIGFAKKDKERIFNVFERLHGRSEYQGTGVGLAICRKIVERHGGTIIAESTPGQGATFTITLPNLKEHP